MTQRLISPPQRDLDLEPHRLNKPIIACLPFLDCQPPLQLKIEIPYQHRNQLRHLKVRNMPANAGPGSETELYSVLANCDGRIRQNIG